MAALPGRQGEFRDAIHKALGEVHKWADKWGKEGPNVWHEKWGESAELLGGWAWRWS